MLSALSARVLTASHVLGRTSPAVRHMTTLCSGKVRAVRCAEGSTECEDALVPVLQIERPCDLLVRVKAVSVNPIDNKIRKGGHGLHERIMGFDVAGIVEDVGEGCSMFQRGDEVYYAGDITRPGSYQELHVVDERIVAKKPSSLSFAEAAALPLVSLTAWEGLLEGLGLDERADASEGEDTQTPLLVIAGAGGVGSMATQIGKSVLKRRVIASASRDETRAFVEKMGADMVLNHRHPYRSELTRLGVDGVDHVICCANLDGCFDDIVEVLNPLGKICAITPGPDPSKIDATKLFFPKRASLVWELMFTRSMFGIEMERQHDILQRVAELVDGGKIQSTMTERWPFNAANVTRAHQVMDSGKGIGKIVLEM